MKTKEKESTKGNEKGELSFTLDLMDWKQIERQCQTGLTEGKINISISEVLLANAKAQIKKRGGKTLEEEEQEAKEQTTQTNE